MVPKCPSNELQPMLESVKKPADTRTETVLSMYLSFVREDGDGGSFKRNIGHLESIFKERLEHGRAMKRKYGKSYNSAISNLENHFSDLQKIDFSYVNDFCLYFAGVHSEIYSRVQSRNTVNIHNYIPMVHYLHKHDGFLNANSQLFKKPQFLRLIKKHYPGFIKKHLIDPIQGKDFLSLAMLGCLR